MRQKFILILMIFSFSIATAQIDDSTKIDIEEKGSIKTEQLNSTSIENPNSENRVDKYLIALIGLFGVVVASIISYRVANKQNRNKLLETKITILNSQKEKLENIKSQIFDRQVDVSNNTNLSADQIRSMFIDRLLKDISSVQKHSELFDNEFIADLNSYSQRISTYIFPLVGNKNARTFFEILC